MDDQAFPQKASDDKTDTTQSKIGEALNKLPDDLEKIIEPPPVKPAGDFNQAFAKAGANPVSTPTLPPSPVPPQPASSPPTPPPLVDDVKSRSDVTDRGSSAEPGLEMPEVKKEESGSIKPPKRKIGKTVKMVGGVMMLALLISGGIIGMKEVKTRQIIKKNAEECQTVCYDNRWGEYCVPVCGDTMRTYNEEENPGKGGEAIEITKVEEFDPDDYENCPRDAAGETCTNYKYADSKVGTLSRDKVSSSGSIPTSGNCEVWTGRDGNKDGMINQADVRAGDATMTIMPCTEAAKITDPCRQIDWAEGGYNTHIEYDKCSAPPESPEPSPPPLSSPTPSPSPPGSEYSCASLAGDGAYALNSTETFTCTAAFSAVNPVAFFRYNVDGGTYTTSSAVTLTGSSATYDVTVDEYGDWEVQCRVCTDSGATDCTTWGNAN